jgi:hypothetical protein
MYSLLTVVRLRGRSDCGCSLEEIILQDSDTGASGV